MTLRQHTTQGFVVLWQAQASLPPAAPGGAGLPKQQWYSSQGWEVARRQRSVMILPQVHLRKPCYDFYFL
jgi:hypothetical protein